MRKQTSCKRCGNDVWVKAKRCANCGVVSPTKRPKTGGTIMLQLLVLSGVVVALAGTARHYLSESRMEAERQRRPLASCRYEDGSYIHLVREVSKGEVQARMSFEHLETQVEKVQGSRDAYKVLMRYRIKDESGTLQTRSALAITDGCYMVSHFTE